MDERRWEILGVPFDFGSECEGTGQAPEAIRAAGLSRLVEHLCSLGFEVADRGDIALPERVDGGCRPQGLEEMKVFAPALASRLGAMLFGGSTPIVLGGDHSITIASAAAVHGNLRAQGIDPPSVGVLWIDAHPDFETPGPHGTDALNAMPVTHLLGGDVGGLREIPALGSTIDPENLVFVGLRDVLPEERRAIRGLGIRAFSATDVDRIGIAEICREALARVSERTDAVILTFDIDVLDPTIAPGVDYPQPGGLSLREGMLIMEQIHALEKLALVELVEVNPTKDREGMTARSASRLLHRLIAGPVI